MYICMCLAISTEELKDYIKENPNKTEEQIIDALGVSKGCGMCKHVCQKVISRGEKDDREEYDDVCCD